MHIPFLKVQGAGNDFVLVEARGEDPAALRAAWARRAPAICDRHFGAGADGVLLVADSAAGADAQMIIINADGSEAEMCGNGIRCFAKYLVERGGVAAHDGGLDIETGAGVLRVELPDGGPVDRVRVDMGPAHLEPSEIPVNAEGPAPILALPLEVGGMTLEVTCVSMGNPHAVLFTDIPVDEFPLHEIGPQAERHALFPKRTNFAIVNVESPSRLKVRVWERGVGETLACGSGACAVLVAATLHQFSPGAATVALPGGDLEIAWDGQGPVFMTGPAAFVYEGAWQED